MVGGKKKIYTENKINARIHNIIKCRLGVNRVVGMGCGVSNMDDLELCDSDGMVAQHEGLANHLVKSLVGWLVGSMRGWRTDWVIVWLVACLVGLFGGGSIGWLIGWLVVYSNLNVMARHRNFHFVNYNARFISITRFNQNNNSIRKF